MGVIQNYHRVSSGYGQLEQVIQFANVEDGSEQGSVIVRTGCSPDKEQFLVLASVKWNAPTRAGASTIASRNM